MYVIIETATTKGLLALASGSQVIASRELLLGLGNSRELEPAMEAMFQEANIKPADLHFVAVGRGPGSYTGIRVGAACAKALAIGLNVPLVGVSSLKSFVPPDAYEGHFCAVIDAKIGGVYYLEGKKEKNQISYLGNEAMVSIEALSDKLGHIPCLVTPLWKPLEARITKNFPLHLFEVGPSAKQLAQEAEFLFSNKKYTLDGSCELLYLRLTQAEMEKLPNKPHLG